MKTVTVLIAFLLWFTAVSAMENITVVPDTYSSVVDEAYQSLPSHLQKALWGGSPVEVYIKDGDILGGAVASDHFGSDLQVHSAYVRWPGTKTVSFPWGEISILDAIRHELAHVALERIFRNNSQMWVELLQALREEGPEFLKKVAWGHANAADLYSSSAIAGYESLHEYLASLVEHCGKPVRMPLPSGRARPMVESLVAGGRC